MYNYYVQTEMSVTAFQTKLANILADNHRFNGDKLKLTFDQDLPGFTDEAIQLESTYKITNENDFIPWVVHTFIALFDKNYQGQLQMPFINNMDDLEVELSKIVSDKQLMPKNVNRLSNYGLKWVYVQLVHRQARGSNLDQELRKRK